MRYFVLLITLAFSSLLFADQRMETRDNFCHAVTPEGFATGNDDNEVFLSGCNNSIRQNADGTGSGSYQYEIDYPAGSLPFTEDYETSGAETGVPCVMVDSNGTTYTTNDWEAEYEVKAKKRGKGEIEYTLACFNGEQR